MYASLLTKDFVATMKGEDNDIRVYSWHIAALVGYIMLTINIDYSILKLFCEIIIELYPICFVTQLYPTLSRKFQRELGAGEEEWKTIMEEGSAVDSLA